MQPYLFPYLGYFQLIRAVDVFVVYDDVNYINGGWINRNFILANGNRQRITLPLQAASQNKLINQVEIGGKHKILQSVRQSYGKAPHFHAVYPTIEEILTQTEKNLARFLDYQLRLISDYLGLKPQWNVSSTLQKDTRLRGQDKILSICEGLGVTEYVNMPGGKAIYDKKSFAEKGIKLSYVQPEVVTYGQFSKEFVPSLSIIDVMMFNSREQCAILLENYELI